MTTERILIVDDEETLCEVLKLNLENEGYDVDIAFSAEQALTLDLKQYSLILLDIMMGEISGIKMAIYVSRRKRAVAFLCYAIEVGIIGGSDRKPLSACKPLDIIIQLLAA